jgi:predicted TIM-barrel fold metal-dependent hydrolase
MRRGSFPSRYVIPSVGGELRPFVSVTVVLIAPALLVMAQVAQVPSVPPPPRPPIIDVHLHAYSPDDWARDGRAGVPNPTTGARAPLTAEDHQQATLAAMREYNIVAGVVSGSLEAVDWWRRVAPDRVLAALSFGRPGFDDFGRPLAIDTFRKRYRAGQLKVMGELGAAYHGLSPSDPAFDEYYVLAEELNIPVGIHTGTGPSGVTASRPMFRARLGNPLLIEDVLVHHPKLRVYIMHGGEPWRQETLAMLQQYPSVYLDIAVINWVEDFGGRSAFHAFLKDFVDRGYGKRILFGSDQMVWPDAIGHAVEAVESATFLTEEQRRDILYYNARRFLGIEPAGRKN